MIVLVSEGPRKTLESKALFILNVEEMRSLYNMANDRSEYTPEEIQLLEQLDLYMRGVLD